MDNDLLRHCHCCLGFPSYDVILDRRYAAPSLCRLTFRLNSGVGPIQAPLVRNMILVNRLALTCFYVGSQFETKTDQSSYVPKIFYELILINGSFVDSLLGCHWMKLLSTPDTSLERSTHLFLCGFLV